MGIDALAARLSVTAVTPRNQHAVTAKPAPSLACTAVTSVTAQKTVTADESDIRAQLHSVAGAEKLSTHLVDRLTDDDVRACVGLPNATLRAYVLALHDADLRERGKVPADETARAMCRYCGPVFVHPIVAVVAPLVDGWPRVLGCPWCHVKNRRAMPRPVDLQSAGSQSHRKTNPIEDNS